MVLFNESIFYNIAYGKLGASREEVYAAARQAAIHDQVLAVLAFGHHVRCSSCQQKQAAPGSMSCYVRAASSARQGVHVGLSKRTKDANECPSGFR